MEKPQNLVLIEQKLGIETTCIFKESKPEEVKWVYDNRRVKYNKNEDASKSKFVLMYFPDRVFLTVTWPLSSSVDEKNNIIFDFEPLYTVLNTLLDDEVLVQDIFAAVWSFAVKKRKTRSKNKNIRKFECEDEKYGVLVTTDGYVSIECYQK